MVLILIIFLLYLIALINVLHLFLCPSFTLVKFATLKQIFQKLIKIPHIIIEKIIDKYINTDSPNPRRPTFFVFLFYVISISYFFFYLFKVHPSLPLITDNYLLHTALSYIVILFPWLLFFYIQLIDPGFVTESNVNAYMELYPYDHVIYHPMRCPITFMPAVARSSFSIYDGKRVSKFWFFSFWLSTTIGERNIRWYIIFIFSNLFATIYQLMMAVRLIIYKQNQRNLEIQWDDSDVRNAVSVVINLMVSEDLSMIGYCLSLGMTAIALGSYFVKQSYRITKNVTPYEEDYYNLHKDRKNAYNNGVFENWYEVLFPPTLYE